MLANFYITRLSNDMNIKFGTEVWTLLKNGVCALLPPVRVEAKKVCQFWQCFNFPYSFCHFGNCVDILYFIRLFNLGKYEDLSRWFRFVDYKVFVFVLRIWFIWHASDEWVQSIVSGTVHDPKLSNFFLFYV